MAERNEFLPKKNDSGGLKMETPVTRMLDFKEIDYDLISHKVPIYSCGQVSKVRNIALENIVKCILLCDKYRRYVVVCLAANEQADLGKIRSIAGYSRLSFATKEELELVTGYKSGMLAPFLFKMENIPIIFEKNLKKNKIVDISSGSPNSGIQLTMESLIILVNPIFEDVIK